MLCFVSVCFCYVQVMIGDVLTDLCLNLYACTCRQFYQVDYGSRDLVHLNIVLNLWHVKHVLIKT